MSDVKRTVYTPTEDAEQAALFQWAERAACTIPELRLMYHIANGGYRHPATAARLRSTGVKPGVPDICLPVARGGRNGLYVEMKRVRGGVVSVAQKAWHVALREQGYAVEVCKGWEAAKGVIERYLKGGDAVK